MPLRKRHGWFSGANSTPAPVPARTILVANHTLWQQRIVDALYLSHSLDPETVCASINYTHTTPSESPIPIVEPADLFDEIYKRHNATVVS